MAKRTQTRAPAKTSAEAPTKSPRGQPEKSRAARLAIGHSKKTTPARSLSKKPRAGGRAGDDQTAAKRKNRKSTSRNSIETEATHALEEMRNAAMTLKPALRTADAVQRAAKMSTMPLGLLMRQQALVLDLILDALRMQRRFFDMWRPL